jgi:hypothetical protein
LTLLLATLAVACGKDSGTNPPPAGEPASIAIHAGNGQTAAAGSPVAINPTFIVKDAAGTPVPSVRVDFTVEQGGGAFGVASRFTDENGLASPGQWVLGDTPGPQAMSGKIFNSSIPKATITATAAAPQDVILTQTVTAAGGKLTVNRPGSALHGASLEFDTGAFTGAAAVTLMEVSTAGLTIPTGMQAISPGLGIASSVTELKAGAVITLPATAVTGKVVMIALGNPATGKITILPTVSSSANSISALIPALDSRAVPTIRLGGGMDEELMSIPFLIGINEELLARDFDSGFRPGADDWELKPMGIAALPFLTLHDFPPFGQVGVVDDGLVSTAIWYYVNRRKAGGPPLHGSLQEAAGQPYSARLGIRWAALAEKNVPSFNQVGSLAAEKWQDLFTDDPARFSRLQFQAIKALMLTTFERPVPVVLLEVDDPDEFNADAAPLAIAYRTAGNTLSLAIAHEPGKEFQVQFTEQGMVPFDIQKPMGGVMRVRAVAGVHYVNVVDEAKLAAQWTRVANGTIGEAEGWPTPKLVWEKAELDTAKIYLLDELQHWWECASCPERVPTPAQLPATASHVQRTQFGKYTGGTLGPLTGNTFSSMTFDAADLLAGSTEQKVGSVIWHPLASDTELGIGVGWLDWITTTYRKLELEPSVAKITFSKDTTITLALTPSEAPPTGTRYRWLLRTATSQDSVETNTATHTRDLEADTEGWLVFSAIQGEHERPIARDSIEITGAESTPHWRLLTLANPDDIFEDLEGSGDQFELLQRVIQSAATGLISIEQNGGVQELRLRVKRSGVWTAENFPVPAHNIANEWLLPLGVKPTASHPVGPFFAGWGTSFWTQTVESLDAGTITGQYVTETMTYAIKDAGNQTGPAGGFRFTATRNGKLMTGELVLYMWWIDDESGEVEEAPDVYHFPFTAGRIR